MRLSVLGRAALATLAVALIAPLARAHDEPDARFADGARVQALVKADFAAGRIDFESYLLENFRLAFAPSKASAAYARPDGRMEPCFTPWVLEYQTHRDALSPEAVEEIESYLRHPRSAATSSYISPSGLFELHYETTGPDAVPLDDVSPANGIPDFVEMCADVYDSSWTTEVTELGFGAPKLPTDGTYDCYFQAFSAGLYGVTSIVGAGRTEITVDNDFTGIGQVFSPDPDGPVVGRARGVLSHEFKHATQYEQSSWSEGSWVELDANWVMDVVFDTSDIYHAWLAYPNSQLSSPQTTLTDNAGAGNYEDLIWETYLGERFGLQFLTDFWARRATVSGESPKATYAQILSNYGSTWNDAYPEYMEWCWFTGSRAETGIGFEEAASMQRMSLFSSPITTYPYAAAGSVDELAAHARRFNTGTATGSPRVVFNGDDAHCCWTVSVLVKDNLGNVTIVQPALDAANDCDYLVPTTFANVSYVGVIITNSLRSGGLKPYTLDVLDDAGGVVDAPAVGVDVRPLAVTARPNPARGAMRIDYALPSATTGRLGIYDVRGRTVRVLTEGTLPAGAGTVTWDGRDASSRPLAAGVYWARLDTPVGRVSRKITLIR